MSMKWFPVYMKNRKKWFPKSVSHSRAVTTEQLCKDIAQSSTVAPGDVTAVLRTLSDAMVKYLADGRPVKLDNIGTFRLVASASGNGVDKEEQVTTDQFNKMMVRFLPEKVSAVGGIKSQSIPVLANTEIQWERTEPKKTKGTAEAGETPTGGNGNTTPTGDGDEGGTPTGGGSNPPSGGGDGGNGDEN